MNTPKPEAELLAYPHSVHAIFAAAALQKTRRPIMNASTPTPTERAHAASLELIAAQQALETLYSGPVENADSLAWCHKYTATLAEVNRARAVWFDALDAMD